MLEKLTNKFAVITEDYHYEYNDGFVMTGQHVLRWVNQFEEKDRIFVLSEILHVLQQGIYVSKPKANAILWGFVKSATIYFGYQSVEMFMRETLFISMQGPEKSQTTLLSIINELLIENIGYSIEICGTFRVRNYIYLDDVLGSGGRFNFEVYKFISDNNLLKALQKKEVRILSYFFCIHTWGASNARYVLKNRFEGENFFLDSKAFPIKSYYTIENNIKDYNQRLNLVYPQKSKQEYDAYISSLVNATRQGDRAYRWHTLPNEESFFTSKENRIRLEQIFLDKGIEIINMIRDDDSRQKHRPLGKTYPSYKTFGTGSLFFTWRNISNTCPIVFWWDNPVHNWRGLFPLHNRGN